MQLLHNSKDQVCIQVYSANREFMIIQLSLNKPSPTPFVCKFKAWACSL